MRSLPNARSIFWIAIAVGLVVIHSSAQNRQQKLQEATELNDQVDEGDYEHATRLAKSLFDRLHIWGPDGMSILQLAYIGKTQVEVGRLAEAVKVLGEAEALSPKAGNFYDPAWFRETAALELALGQFQAAASTAAKAVQLAEDRSQDKLRVGYCRSLEAMALLRLGKPSDAELLSLKAVKDCPKKTGKYFVFAPRILYTACLVESYQENYAEAEEYCRRGLEFAQQSKRENRDLSLGYLAFAEAYLEAGEITRSREAASKNVEITSRLFGEQHQDMVQALELLAQISAKQGNMADACTEATRAVKIATAIFGPESAGAAGPVRALHMMDFCLQQAPR